MKSVLARVLTQASIDSFCLSVFFGLWGAASIVSGTGIGYLVGAVQLLASFLNFSSGLERRAMAKVAESAVLAEADKPTE